MRHLYYSNFLSKVLLVKSLHIPKFYRLLFILYTYCTFFVFQWSLINWDKNLSKILLKYAMVWKCIPFKFGTIKASPRLKKKQFAVKLAYFFLVLCSLTTLSTNRYYLFHVYIQHYLTPTCFLYFTDLYKYNLDLKVHPQKVPFHFPISQ